MAEDAGGSVIGFGFAGGIAGAVIGYLLGTNSFLSFGAVLTRGATLTGIDVRLIPAAQTAFNFMIAEGIAGAFLGDLSRCQ